ncbi:MAG TPA: thiamine-phosphate kinase [Polyangiaceae bacterium]|nr:thiamine-phosphate kinase [Polyangiaceae bacterium]
MDEVGRIAMLAGLLRGSGRGIDVGIGDDAAVLSPPPGKLVWTIDEQVEGVHFRRDLASWHDVGWRSFAAAASDLAAMGATPWCALAALVLPADVDDAALAALAGGQKDAAAAVGAPLVGGNLARGPALSIATTLLGSCEAPVERRGARVGDGLWLAGRVGLAAAGLRALDAGRGGDPRLASAVAAWRTPQALIAAGLAMGGAAHAGVDVSDGLARDAGHLGEASGVQLLLDEAALLEDAALLEAAQALGADPLDLALHGGEDYALVAATPRPIAGFRRIGEVRAGTGLVLRTGAGERPLEPRGFDHFAR